MIFLFSRPIRKRMRRRRRTKRICQLGCYFLAFADAHERVYELTHTYIVYINTLSTIRSKWVKCFCAAKKWHGIGVKMKRKNERQFFAVHAILPSTRRLSLCTISLCYRSALVGGGQLFWVIFLIILFISLFCLSQFSGLNQSNFLSMQSPYHHRAHHVIGYRPLEVVVGVAQFTWSTSCYHLKSIAAATLYKP